MIHPSDFLLLHLIAESRWTCFSRCASSQKPHPMKPFARPVPCSRFRHAQPHNQHLLICSFMRLHSFTSVAYLVAALAALAADSPPVINRAHHVPAGCHPTTSKDATRRPAWRSTRIDDRCSQKFFKHVTERRCVRFRLCCDSFFISLQR